jgi:hypothetical protein
MKHYAAVVAVTVTFALACGRTESRRVPAAPTTACTDIGCVNNLTVEIQNAPPGPITVRAEPVGTSDTVHTAICSGETGCTNTIFSQFAPAHVHLTVATISGTRQFDVRPSFQTSQPNGPGCPEICRYGTVRITWP